MPLSGDRRRALDLIDVRQLLQRDPSSGRLRVFKGGNWGEMLPVRFRCATRGGQLPHSGNNVAGMRLVIRPEGNEVAARGTEVELPPR